MRTGWRSGPADREWLREEISELTVNERRAIGWADWVWLDGRILRRAEARVSAFDRGLLLGDGVYETVRAQAGKVFRWVPHRNRLARSLAGAQIRLPFPMERVEEGIQEVLEANHLEAARIRLTITRGEGGPGFEIPADSPPATVIVAASAWRSLPSEKYRDGVAAVVPGVRQTPASSLDPALKSISRIHLVLARLEVARRGAHEAILLTTRDEVAEGTSSNVFLVRAGVLRTPSLETGILEGVTREAVLDLAQAAGIPTEESRMAERELDRAEEVFFTNTSWGALPVTRVDGGPVGSGRPGPVTQELGKGLAALVERECPR